MTKMTFDEFQSIAMKSKDIGFKVRENTLDPGTGKRFESEVPALWYYVGLDRDGESTVEKFHPKEFYFLAKWKTGGYGFNTTGEGPESPEPKKELFAPLGQFLEKVCPKATRTKAEALSREIAAGSLNEQGQYEAVVGDGVIEEYHIHYSFQAVSLRAMYQWLVEQGWLEGDLPA